MKRLYVVVRGDLPPGLQMAQACHVTREFTRLHPRVDVGENLIALSVPDEEDLEGLLFAAVGKCRAAAFCEPDLGGEMTALALSGKRARSLLGGLPLALREEAPTSNLT